MATKVDSENATLSLKEKIVQKLDELPDLSLVEILSFIENLNPKEERAGHVSAFRAVIGTVPGAALTNEEIDLELYGPIAVRGRIDEA